MTETIPQHRHCFVCGKTHTGDGRFCSEACKDVKRADLKKKKRQLWVIMGLAVAMMVFAIFSVM
jgi:predicted nucleic acid-binding Zn ribbon protein